MQEGVFTAEDGCETAIAIAELQHGDMEFLSQENLVRATDVAVVCCHVEVWQSYQDLTDYRDLLERYSPREVLRLLRT